MVSHLAQAWSALLGSPPCAQCSVFLAATLFVQPLDHSFTPIPPPFILPLINHCDRCLVPLAWGLKAGGHKFPTHGGVHWNSVQGLAVPQVEAPGHPAHPPPLATQWWEIKGLKFMPNFRVLMIFSSREKSRVVCDAIPIMQEMRCDW